MTAYEVLGCSETATPDELRRAWKHLSATNHPDRGGDEVRFKTIQGAWAQVASDEARRAYDDELARARARSAQPDLADFEAVLRKAVGSEKADALTQLVAALNKLL